MKHNHLFRKKQRAYAVVLAASMLATATQALSTTPVTVQGVDINYASALQMSLYFYECQQAGELPAWNRVEWRGDATVGDPVPGGWYDAGDHVKFNLPMSYSTTMLAWGLYLYADGVKACGEYTNYVNNLKWTLDYFAKCDLGDSAIYQVGDGTDDHSWWGPVELLEYGMEDQNIAGKRTTIEGRDASAVTAEMGAALAAGYCALKDSKMVSEAELTGYLTHAKSLFKIANEDRSDDAYNKSDAQGFYQSRQFYDDLFFCANWLYMATGDKAYLDDAKELIAGLGKELGSSDLKYSWANCWDDVQQGASLLYAINTGDATWKAQVKKHMDYWKNSTSVLDGGLVYVDSWGCLRYACGVGFVVAAACDTLFKDDPQAAAYKTLYESQINYCLGANPNNRSYVIGYDESSPAHPHHRTAHGSWKNDLAIPDQSRHQLFGALVGGPDSKGVYTDDRGLFVYTEVATDYNAAYTALLCKMVTEYGGKTDPTFPQPDQRDDELFVSAKVTNSASGSTVSMKITNHTAWPARVVDNLSMRYYMDLTEVIDAGLSPTDVTMRCDRDQSAMYSGKGYKTAEISEIKQYKGNIYYVEVTFPDGRVVLPISEGQHQCEILLALVYPNYGSGWDATNDYSAQGLDAKENQQTAFIPVYENGTLIYGTEPDGTKGTGSISANPPAGGSGAVVSDTTTTTTETTPVQKVSYGDVNCDEKVDIGDVILLNRYVAEDKDVTVTKQGIANADCVYDLMINSTDTAQIMRYLAKIIPLSALGPQA